MDLGDASDSPRSPPRDASKRGQKKDKGRSPRTKGRNKEKGKRVDDDPSPVIAFVNTKSGGRAGQTVLANLTKILGEECVFDLQAEGGPEAGLRQFQDAHRPPAAPSQDERSEKPAGATEDDPEAESSPSSPGTLKKSRRRRRRDGAQLQGHHLRVLACGGDGTFRWVVQGLLNVWGDDHPQLPLMGVIPLGTGNDLSREYGWGGGFDDGGSVDVLTGYIEKIRQAPPRPLDLWTASHRGPEKSRDSDASDALDSDSDSNSASESTATDELFFNYFNCGFDPQVAMGFHTLRNNSPHLFRARWMNKAWYVAHALKALASGSHTLAECCTLKVDGALVDIPADTRSIVVLNFTCYQAGADIWGPDTNLVPDEQSHEGDKVDLPDGAEDHETDRFERVSKMLGPPAMDDGFLEVVGINGIVHNTMIRVDMSAGVRIARGSNVEITVGEPVSEKELLPCACDGEPFSLGPGTVSIRHVCQVGVLAHPDHEN
jgi:Diacylglycerol kinase accessory domain/Diacylglycerol kinase catalytic domain